MTHEKQDEKKQDVKKQDEKKQNDFWSKIKGLSKVDTHLKNLQKLSDKMEVKGLSNFVPFSTDIVMIYNEVKAQAEKSSLYPEVKVISGGDSSLTYVANQSNELILLTVKGLETLYKSIAPTDVNSVDEKADNITEQFKNIKIFLNL